VLCVVAVRLRASVAAAVAVANGGVDDEIVTFHVF